MRAIKVTGRGIEDCVVCKKCGAQAHERAKKVATWVDQNTHLCNECSE